MVANQSTTPVALTDEDPLAPVEENGALLDPGIGRVRENQTEN